MHGSEGGEEKFFPTPITSRTDDLDRFVQCLIANPHSEESKKPRVLLELPSSELATLSRSELSARLEESLGHPLPEDEGL